MPAALGPTYMLHVLVPNICMGCVLPMAHELDLVPQEIMGGTKECHMQLVPQTPCAASNTGSSLYTAGSPKGWLVLHVV